MVRARTRENPFSREALAAIGITPTSVVASLEAGQVAGWVCESGSAVVGFCNGDLVTGEILVLAVAPEAEGRGVGKRLLAEMTRELGARGHRRLRLAASPDSSKRSYGFYRSQGWVPTGELNGDGDEILLREV